MNIFNRWSAWEDVGIEYIHADFKWVVIQTRTRKSDNSRQIRHVEIYRYGGQMSSETQKAFYKLFKVGEK
jgi:tRNA A37 N6-isopentenylltransferase MiaA